jgi:hypothetical protein
MQGKHLWEFAFTLKLAGCLGKLMFSAIKTLQDPVSLAG